MQVHLADAVLHGTGQAEELGLNVHLCTET